LLHHGDALQFQRCLPQQRVYGVWGPRGIVLCSNNMRERWLLRERYLCRQRPNMPRLDRQLLQRKLRELRRPRAGSQRSRLHRAADSLPEPEQRLCSVRWSRSALLPRSSGGHLRGGLHLQRKRHLSL